ncbi:MAG: tyrosine-type recombinase/integrase, partial [Candidatus Tectimicrobiota bacterium]
MGLRLHEALFLQVSEIDGQRLQLHVPRGKGAKDRYVPLPAETLALLRPYWKTHRHPTWLFPATGRNHPQRPPATTPMSRSSVQGAFRPAKYRAGLTQTGGALHTLRPSYTTPLLEAGVNPRLIQRYLGHPQLETSMEGVSELWICYSMWASEQNRTTRVIASYDDHPTTTLSLLSGH